MKNQVSVPALKIKRVNKTYAVNKVTANKDIILDIFPGEIFSIVGENGTGKSTLLNIISGEILPDSGKISIFGKEVMFNNPGDAQKAGIGMVHQHPRIIPELTVLENILLGRNGQKTFRMLNMKKEREKINSIFSDFNITIDPDLPGSELTSSQEIWVVLTSLIFHNCKIILLDESTSTMTDEEIIHFFSVIKKLTDKKITIVYISHKLKEVITYSDRIGVMKNGSIQSIYHPYETSRNQLYKTLFPNIVNIKKEEVETGEEVFRVENLSLKQKKSFLVNELSFHVNAGETLAITGLRESGLEVIEELISGLVPSDTGSISINKIIVKPVTIKNMRNAGMTYIPTARMTRGTCLEAELWENLLITSRESIHSKGIINKSAIITETIQQIKSFQIKGKPHSKMVYLSGGNIQKVIASRELRDRCRVMIFSEPSWGLDGSSRKMIYSKLNKLKKNGAAVIILSTDMEEVLSQSDRVVIIHNRKPFAEFKTNDLDSFTLGKLMFGINLKEDIND